MNLLLILSLIWVAILILALAASLITILIFAIRISRRLSETQTVLASVQTSTSPLNGPLELLQKTGEALHSNLAIVGADLSQAGQKISILADRSK